MEYALLTLDDRVYPSSYDDYDPAGIKIEAHYAANKHWLKERFILDNAPKLTLPVFLIQGRYDMICPPFAAFELHKVLPQSKLIWTVAGHSGSDRANYDVLRTILLKTVGA
jgi:proline iminopeptidase